MLVKDRRWRSSLGISLANKLKSQFRLQSALVGVLTEKWQLKGIGASRVFSPFGGRIGLLQVRDCKGECVWRRKCLNFVGKRTQKCDKEN